MVKKIIVCCIDEDVKSIVLKGFSSLMGENQITVCRNVYELHNSCRYANDTAVIFDKYFLGYVLSYELIRLKYLNDKLLTYFVELGDCSHYLAMRVHQLGVEGFIPQIENEEYFKNSINNIKSGMRLYPDQILKSFEDGDYLLDQKSISEVTEKEMQIGLYLGNGFTQKELCYITGLSKQTVSCYTRRLKRKIGYKKPDDFTLLCKSYFSKNTGGDDDNKD